MTAIAVVMAILSGARISRGWPAGAMTYIFFLATALVILTAILAWRRVNAHTQPRRG
jgi:predicted small integral membrane protein